MRNEIAFSRIVRLALAYSDANEDAKNEEPADTGSDESAASSEEQSESFVIPEDFSDISDSDLTALHSKGVEAFEALYGDGSSMSDDDLTALAELTEGIEAMNAEIASREEAAEERSSKAREMAAKVNPKLGADTTTDGDDADEDDEDTDETDETDEDSDSDDEEEDEDEDNENEDDSASKTVTASGKKKRKSINVNLGNLRGRNPMPAQQQSAPSGMNDVAFNSKGEATDWKGLSSNLARQLQSMPQTQYRAAASRNQHMREQHSLGVFRKPFNDDQMITSNDPEHIESVMSRAVDESRTPKGSLVASGGWCAPSETLYDFLELESRDGLLSMPEVGVTRGGINFTQGPDFADIFSDTGFSFTEAEDITGEYPGTDGNKPFYDIDCPEFEETRLAVQGLAINAGLLQLRAYPEVIQRVVRGALVAHDHKLSATLINALAEGSDAVTMPTGQVGAAAPILNSIELQVQHYRTKHRLPLSASLEAVFPTWTHGAIRADLARREGLDVLSVSDAQINTWFSQRGINAQFVYNWQSIDSQSAAEFTAWPTEVSFLLYAAGTWVRGSSDIITLDTIYDSVNLAQNDYTALFTEEGWLAAKRGHDSRLVTVGLDASGSTGGSIVINHDGTASADGGDTEPVT